MTWSLRDVESALAAAWDADTCDPDDLPWSQSNPARGQCGVTALVLHDLFGGDLVLGEVYSAGERTGYHYWNLLASGIEVDLTRAQFAPDEIVTEGQLIERPAGPPGRCREQYELLRSRVRASLGGSEPPVSY